VRGIPNAEAARIDSAKLQYYLLSRSHSIGRSKAQFFRGLGFDESNLLMFADSLKDVARGGEVKALSRSEFGAKYVVDGTIATPNGRNARVRTVWIVERGRDYPRLVTAYPV